MSVFNTAPIGESCSIRRSRSVVVEAKPRSAARSNACYAGTTTAQLPALEPSGGDAHDLNHYTQLILEQAKELYRYWPEIEDRLFG